MLLSYLLGKVRREGEGKIVSQSQYEGRRENE